MVPLYLAECLSAQSRGKGTGIFQWLLTLGIVAAALIAIFFSMWLDQVEKLGDADQAVRRQGPGVAEHLLGVAAAGRAVRAGQPARARVAAVAVPPRAAATPRWPRCCAPAANSRPNRNWPRWRTRPPPSRPSSAAGRQGRESLLRRKYVLPFLLACIILACNQSTGVNSIIGYNATILIQAGLSDVQAHWGYVILTSVNFLVTMIGVLLVDRKGRKFLLSLGTAGIIVSLVGAGLMFQQTEKARVDCKEAVQAMVTSDQELTLKFDPAQADDCWRRAARPARRSRGRPATLVVIYSYGDFVAATNAVRSDDRRPSRSRSAAKSSLPTGKVEAFFKNPLADLAAAQAGPAEDRQRPDHARAERAERLADGRCASSSSWLFSPSGRACACGWPSRN